MSCQGIARARYLLVECDWENADQHGYFGIPPVPGLAEWLRENAQRQTFAIKSVTICPSFRAGDGQQDAVRLLQNIMKRGLQNTLARNDENLLIDLPPVITSSFSVFAASMVEALALVVRAGVTPDNLVADACTYLGDCRAGHHSQPGGLSRQALFCGGKAL